MTRAHHGRWLSALRVLLACFVLGAGVAVVAERAEAAEIAALRARPARAAAAQPVMRRPALTPAPTPADPPPAPAQPPEREDDGPPPRPRYLTHCALLL